MFKRKVDKKGEGRKDRRGDMEKVGQRRKKTH